MQIHFKIPLFTAHASDFVLMYVQIPCGRNLMHWYAIKDVLLILSSIGARSPVEKGSESGALHPFRVRGLVPNL